MKRRLFWKILLGFWGTFLVLSCGLWVFWSLQPARLFYDWDAPHAVGDALVSTAATVLGEGGTEGLRRYTAAWSPDQRARLTVATLSVDPCVPLPGRDSRDIARAVGTGAGGYCLRYDTPPLPDAGDWTVLDMPPESMVAAALAGLAFSAALAWYITRPIRRLQRGFEQLARGELDTRLAVSMGRRQDEVADLARDFDRMAARLQELVGARDRLLHDVSHELRSPLARMRVATGLLRRYPGRLEASLDRIDREADQLDALVGELLTLAKLESGAGKATDYFDVLEVLRLVLEDLQFEAAAAGVVVKASLPTEDDGDAWLVSGSGVLAHRAVENVVRNALRFSTTGQTIGVTIEKLRQDRCVIVVEDEGPGIDQASAQLLEPFVQGGQAADGSGFGLGLAIAQRAVATCGGLLELVNRTPVGLRVTIDLPLARGEAAD